MVKILSFLIFRKKHFCRSLLWADWCIIIHYSFASCLSKMFICTWCQNVRFSRFLRFLWFLWFYAIWHSSSLSSISDKIIILLVLYLYFLFEINDIHWIKQVEHNIETCNEHIVTIICKLYSWHIKSTNGIDNNKWIKIWS